MKKEIPDEIQNILLWLEAKQVLRGFKSEIFSDMTYEDALRIRQIKREKKDESKND